MKQNPDKNTTWHVEKASALLPYLYESLNHFKKTKVKQILKYGSIRVNGCVVTAHNHWIRPKDMVEFLSKKDAVTEGLKSQFQFPIVYEDGALIVVDKPHGLLTIGTDRERDKTLYSYLTEYERAKSNRNSGRVFIVHRLDREASGLVVLAKTEPIQSVLQKNWIQAVKKYSAVTEGVPPKRTGIIKSHLEENKSGRVYGMPQPSKNSRPAITHYRLLKQNGKNALLEVTLQTGRKNQIRIHLADLGYPIIGDKKYGAASNPLRRLALHAGFLSFPHPTTGKIMSFLSKRPNGFEKLCRKKPITKL